MSDRLFSLLLPSLGLTVKLWLELTNMPVHNDINLPSIQSFNNSIIIQENSTCSLFVHVFSCFIKSNFISKAVPMHDLFLKKKIFNLPKEAKKKR